jgi:23S rRNA (adenine2503-C2)-methyltransferase
VNIFGLTCADLASEMRLRYGKGLHHASALYREIFKKGNISSFADAPEFTRSRELGRQLARDLRLPSCRIIRQQEDGVVKFASALVDNYLIESVVIPADGRSTLCVSSQVGCRMGCRFCTTGGMGFVRNLSPEEIVWQVHAARFTLGHRIDNVVFMGMGEPLDNFEGVTQAVRVLSDQHGLDIALSHITVSTAGHGDGLRNLAALNLRKLRLAVSLNAADNALRSTLMPINRKFPLERLREELRAFPLAGDSVIFIEYVLLAGINDSREDAEKLIHYLAGLPPVRVNVIPYNESRLTPYSRPASEQVKRFCGRMTKAGVFVRVRQSRGRDIMAACGQLGASLSSTRTPKIG